jgi:hypothetical protein
MIAMQISGRFGECSKVWLSLSNPNYLLMVTDREITMIRDWISTSQFGEIHGEHKRQRNADTCHWLGKNDRFAAWINYESSSKLLWLKGARM